MIGHRPNAPPALLLCLGHKHKVAMDDGLGNYRPLAILVRDSL